MLFLESNGWIEPEIKLQTSAASSFLLVGLKLHFLKVQPASFHNNLSWRSKWGDHQNDKESSYLGDHILNVNTKFHDALAFICPDFFCCGRNCHADRLRHPYVTTREASENKHMMESLNTSTPFPQCFLFCLSSSFPSIVLLSNVSPLRSVDGSHPFKNTFVKEDMQPTFCSSFYRLS